MALALDRLIESGRRPGQTATPAPQGRVVIATNAGDRQRRLRQEVIDAEFATVLGEPATCRAHVVAELLADVVVADVSWLRRKLEAVGPRLNYTIRGMGYVLRSSPRRPR